MSTANPSPTLESALGGVPAKLRIRLLSCFADLKTALVEQQYEMCGLRVGKFAEVMLRILQHILTGTYTNLGSPLGNFRAQCDQLEQTPKAAGPESLRILVPRALNFVYTLRNKRDIGHVGGDVDANEIDAMTSARIADWCICELLRVVHSLPLEDAQVLCDAIAERRLPVVWSVMGKKRVLDTALSYADQTLLLVYSQLQAGIPTEDLFAWTEHSNKAYYRRDVLGRLHRDRLIEWDKETDMAIISPKGIKSVEERLLAGGKK